MSVHSGRSDDPGLTTELALVLTLLLGALAQSEPAVAAGLGVTLAVLLAAKARLHHFVKSVITQHELRDALILAVASLVILPLVPDRHMGPWEAINPRFTWTIVVLIMAVSALGHIASRALGPRLGLPAAGLASGFVSSTATIAAMGARAAREPALMGPAVAAAVLSSISTVIQMALLLAATSVSVLAELAMPLIFAGTAAVLYGSVFAWKSLHDSTLEQSDPGPAFSIRTAVVLALTLTGMVLLSAALESRMGQTGLLIAALVSGLADAHAAAVSVASLEASGRLQLGDAAVPILAAFSVNTVAKGVVAAVTGGRRFALQISPGLVFMLAAAWAGLYIQRM